MKREIKFRAWDLESKCFTKGEFLASGCHKNEIHVVGVSCDSEEESCNDEVVLEQYIGLRDINSVDIYEGDIVQVIGHAYEISFHDGSFCYIDSGEHYLISTSAYQLLEVIGNVHQNPELLNSTPQLTKI